MSALIHEWDNITDTQLRESTWSKGDLLFNAIRRVAVQMSVTASLAYIKDYPMRLQQSQASSCHHRTATRRDQR